MEQTKEQKETTQKDTVVVRKIGNTTYTTILHFRDDNGETMGDKVSRLIQNELRAK